MLFVPFNPTALWSAWGARPALAHGSAAVGQKQMAAAVAA